TVTIHCELSFPKGARKDLLNYVNTNEAPKLKFDWILLDENLSDVILRTACGKEVPAHRVILAAANRIVKAGERPWSELHPDGRRIKRAQKDLLSYEFVDANEVPKLKFDSVLFDENLSDVKLRTACGKEIPAHRVVLAAASSVFNAMFSHSMLENNSKLVNMTDVSYEAAMMIKTSFNLNCTITLWTCVVSLDAYPYTLSNSPNSARDATRSKQSIHADKGDAPGVHALHCRTASVQENAYSSHAHTSLMNTCSVVLISLAWLHIGIHEIILAAARLVFNDRQNLIRTEPGFKNTHPHICTRKTSEKKISSRVAPENDDVERAAQSSRGINFLYRTPQRAPISSMERSCCERHIVCCSASTNKVNAARGKDDGIVFEHETRTASRTASSSCDAPSKRSKPTEVSAREAERETAAASDYIYEPPPPSCSPFEEEKGMLTAAAAGAFESHLRIRARPPCIAQRCSAKRAPQRFLRSVRVTSVSECKPTLAYILRGWYLVKLHSLRIITQKILPNFNFNSRYLRDLKTLLFLTMSYRTQHEPEPFTDNRLIWREMMILRDAVNWEDELERQKFVHQFYRLILEWGYGRVPDLKDIFRPEQLERLLLDCAGFISSRPLNPSLFTVGKEVIEFVSLSGYRHKPEVVPATRAVGNTCLSRTTPLHLLISCAPPILDAQLVTNLFRIYDKFEANYFNEETGETHFHVACAAASVKVVRQFLELGKVDPNLLVPKRNDIPLHYAIAYGNRPVVELLLRNGADPNFVNVDGSTALHITCRTSSEGALARMLFEISDQRHRPIQVDARDFFGNTPLHLALSYVELGMDLVELLLGRGADPNLADANKSTPLHLICKRTVFNKGDFLNQFIKSAQRQNHKLRFDARDNSGWTPLQWAFASFDPKAVDVLLEHGADLSSFFLPIHLLQFFGAEIDSRNSSYKLRLVSGALATIELLERKGYKWDRPDAMAIMKFFVDYGLVEKTTDEDKSWFLDESSEFVRQAKTIWVSPGLSLHDLIQLLPKEAGKSFSFMDYHRLSCNEIPIKTVYVSRERARCASADQREASCKSEQRADWFEPRSRTNARRLRGIGKPGSEVISNGIIKENVQVDECLENDVIFRVVPDDILPYDVLIGQNFTELPSVVYFKIDDKLEFRKRENHPFANYPESSEKSDVVIPCVAETTNIPPASVNFVRVHVNGDEWNLPVENSSDQIVTVQKNDAMPSLKCSEILNVPELKVGSEPIVETDFTVGPAVSAEQKTSLLNLLNAYRVCCSRTDKELGCTDYIEMDIVEKADAVPVYSKPYKASAKQRETMKNIIGEWKAAGIVKETQSPYASPCLLVDKADGSQRLVVDYRRLNKNTVRMNFPLPNVDDGLEELHGAKMFAILDLAQGYLQIPLSERAKEKTAFITPDDTGQFERAMFGLMNAPFYFSKLMKKVFGNYQNKLALFFFDDMLVYAKSWPELLEKLEKILQLLREARLMLKLRKCRFGLDEVEYVGLIVGKDGIKPGERKIVAINDFPTPRNEHEIRRFIGMSSYFRRFIRNFAQIAAPLNELLRKDNKFFWGSRQQSAFDEIKSKLSSGPVLIPYNPKASRTELHTDASAEGLGAMLFQASADDELHPVYAISRRTTDVERMYHSTKLELLCIVWAMERLRPLLLGIPFTVITDCEALVYVNSLIEN
ncbi:unnamed protein product, partial [Trichogramma brassicae]